MADDQRGNIEEVAASTEKVSKELLTDYKDSGNPLFSNFSDSDVKKTTDKIGEGIRGYEDYLKKEGKQDTLNTVTEYANDVKDKVMEETGDEQAAEFAKNMVATALKPLEYLVRGAKLKCDCGSHTRKLDLSRCHGFHLQGIAMMDEKDCIVDENVKAFGICNNPIRMQEAQLNQEPKVIYKGEDDPSKNAKGFMCTPKILSAGQEAEEVELESGLSYACKRVGNWFKSLVGMSTKVELAKGSPNPSWNDPKEDAYVIGKRLLTTYSWLQCAYGGIITPVSSGQEQVKGGK